MLPYQAALLCYECLKLEHKPMVDAYLRKYPFDNSEMTFADLFIWRKSWGVSVCVAGGALVIRGNHHGEDYTFYPVLGDELAPQLQSILDDTQVRGIPFKMRGVTPDYREAMEKALPNTFEFTEEYDFYDYVYRLEDLQTLSGKKLHGKRNHVNRFLAENPGAIFRPIADGDYRGCMALYEEWLDGHQSKQAQTNVPLTREACLPYIMSDERGMVEEALRHRAALGLFGGVVEIDGVIQAFTLGEQVRDEFITHIEKANPEINGLFAYINQQLALSLSGKGIMYVNREEDMGIEGLRKAKQSYKPVRMIEKYIARRRPCA